MPRRPLPDSRKRLEQQEQRLESRRGTVAWIFVVVILLLLVLAYLYV